MANENKIRILYVQPGKYPEERVIEHTLAAMQTLVGGDIEAVYPWEDMISLCVEHLSVRETAAKLKVGDSTVSTHHKNARDKIRNAMEE